MFDPNKNGIILAAQQRLDKFANNTNYYDWQQLQSSKTVMSDIQGFSNEVKALREFIETENPSL